MVWQNLVPSTKGPSKKTQGVKRRGVKCQPFGTVEAGSRESKEIEKEAKRKWIGKMVKVYGNGSKPTMNPTGVWSSTPTNSVASLDENYRKSVRFGSGWEGGGDVDGREYLLI